MDSARFLYMSLITDLDLRRALEPMILSASGWRKIFAPETDVSRAETSLADRLLFTGIGVVWAEWLLPQSSAVLVASDTRPTGPDLCRALIAGIESCGAKTIYVGAASSPEVMARSFSDPQIEAFAYVSASHNPIQYNGIKFGLNGGVTGGEDAETLIKRFKALVSSNGSAQRLSAIHQGAPAPQVFSKEEKKKTLFLYKDFLFRIAGGSHPSHEKREETLSALKKAIRKQSVIILGDMNGSARTLSADRAYFEELGVHFQTFNDAPGEIAHTIEPEGEALEPCRIRLDQIQTKEQPSLIIGYVPDNDGDRGNLVIWDEALSCSRILEAQEVFALSVLACFSSSKWERGLEESEKHTEAALIVNGPTSHRVRVIAEKFGAKIYETEVGEANLTGRASELFSHSIRPEILGEGSNGGTIIPPASVRDPMNTITAILKLILLPEKKGTPAPFEDWCRRIGRPEVYRKGFGLSDILSTLPLFTTTPVTSERASMKVKTKETGALKEQWFSIFQKEWTLYAQALESAYAFSGWNLITNRKRSSRRNDTSGLKEGGVKVLFYDKNKNDSGFLWMRGSGTEPIVRIMTEIRGNRPEAERALTAWHRAMVRKADCILEGSVSTEKIPSPLGETTGDRT